MAERAVSELLQLDARLGRMSEVEKFLAELGSGRPLHGSSGARLEAAKEGLYVMKNSPQTAFRCGPYALNTILTMHQATKPLDPRLKAVASTTRGHQSCSAPTVGRRGGTRLPNGEEV